jgi:DNA-3-methyladenine glycosylase II
MPGNLSHTGMADIIVRLPPHFSFAECLVFLNRNKNECLHFIKDDAIHKAVTVENKDIIFSIAQNGGSLLIKILNIQKPSAAVKNYVTSYVSGWLDLAADLTPFYKSASGDKVLKELIKNYAGLRLIGIPDLFETLVWCVMGQQINLGFAYTLKKRFVETYGRKIIHKNNSYYLFPAAELIVGQSPEDLRKLQLTSKKSEYIVGIAGAVSSGRISKESLLLQSPEEIKKGLTAIRGVGEWTAEYVMMKCLRVGSAFPAGDAGLQNAVKNILKLESKPSPEELRRMSLKWKGSEAYAVFYLWRSLLD